MSKNLSIEYRPNGWNDGRGNWQVIGKLTDRVYSTGSKYDCTWQISNNPQWYTEEALEHEEAEREAEASRLIYEDQQKTYLEFYDPGNRE